MKKAIVCMRKNGLYLHAQCLTMDGAWIGSEPFLKLELTASPRAQGEAVRRVLAGSKTGIPNPTDYRTSTIVPLYKLAGVESWSAFLGSSKSCSVEKDGQVMSFIPYEKRGSGRSVSLYVMEGESIRIRSNAPPEEIAEALMACLALCS